MSCNLSDPAILATYNEIVSGQPTNWLILGYNDTRDVISLYSKGTGGLSELRENLREEVLYGFVRIDDRYILITYASKEVSGLRRARALVHGRAVGGIFPMHNSQITASEPTDLSDANVQNRLRLASDSPRSSIDRGPTTPTSSSRPQSPVSSRPQSPSSSRRRQGSSTTGVSSPPQSPSPDQPSPNHMTNGTSAEDPVPKSVGEKAEQDHQAHDQAEKKAREEAKRLEAERLAKAEIERLEREEAGRKSKSEADKKAREAERVAAIQREEAERAAAIERADAERQAMFDKAEAEKRAKEKAQAEYLKRQLLEAERSGKGTLLSGFITIQGGHTPFWKRRWFTIKSRTLYVFRDGNDHVPISSFDLSSAVLDTEDENLMPNSFALSFESDASYVFFSDNRQEYTAIVNLLKAI